MAIEYTRKIMIALKKEPACKAPRTNPIRIGKLHPIDAKA